MKRLFPGSTSYKTVTLEVRKVGGNQLLAKIEEKLRDNLHGLYETIDEPYTIWRTGNSRWGTEKSARDRI